MDISNHNGNQNAALLTSANHIIGNNNYSTPQDADEKKSRFVLFTVMVVLTLMEKVSFF